LTKFEKLKRKRREIRDELEYIPSKKQQNLSEKERVEKEKRVRNSRKHQFVKKYGK